MNTINPSVPNNLHTPKHQPAKQIKEDKLEVGTTEAPGESNAKPQAKGVLRLLESGHFEGKGVADVRLRINFYDQVQALDKAKAQEATQQAVDGLGEFVANTIAEYSKIPEDVATGLKAFEDVLTALDTNETDSTSIGSAVRMAFANFATSFRGTPDSGVESESEQVPAAESSSDNSTSVSDVTIAVASPEEGELEFDVEALVSILEEGLSNFESSLALTTEARQFVRPEGNGKAFDKFLAIYESLSAEEVQQDADVPAILVDQTA
jgi:hypothetical protein